MGRIFFLTCKWLNILNGMRWKWATKMVYRLSALNCLCVLLILLLHKCDANRWKIQMHFLMQTEFLRWRYGMYHQCWAKMTKQSLNHSNERSEIASLLISILLGQLMLLIISLHEATLKTCRVSLCWSLETLLFLPCETYALLLTLSAYWKGVHS